MPPTRYNMKQPDRPWTPEEKFLIYSIKHAIRDTVKPSALDRKEERLWAQEGAVDWIFGESNVNTPYSLEWCCHWFGANPETVRAGAGEIIEVYQGDKLAQKRYNLMLQEDWHKDKDWSARKKFKLLKLKCRYYGISTPAPSKQLYWAWYDEVA